MTESISTRPRVDTGNLGAIEWPDVCLSGHLH